MSVNGEALETPEVETEVETPEVETPETGASEEVTPIDRPTRAEKRAARAAENNARRELDTIRQTLEQERKAREDAARELAELKGYVQSQRERETAGRQQDETQQKLAELRRRAKEHLSASANAKSPEVADREFDRYQELNEEIAELRAERRLAPRFQQQQSGVDHAVTAYGIQLMQEFPALNTNAAYRHAVQGLASEWAREKNAQHPAQLHAIARAAAAEVAKTMGVGGQAPPSQKSRSAYNGVASREGDHGGGGTPVQRYNPATMSKDERKLAEQAFPKLDSTQAHKAWAAKMNAHFSKKE